MFKMCKWQEYTYTILSFKITTIEECIIQQIFKLHSEYKPTGDQPQAIEKLVVFCGMWVVEHPDVVEVVVVRV